MKNSFNWKKYLLSSVQLTLSCCLIALSGCGEKSTAPAPTAKESGTTHTAIATVQASTNHLFYSGTLQALTIANIASPADGVVHKLYFRYGSQVDSGQVLLNITSSKSQQDYATALTNYIKDKDQYLTSKNSFAGTTALYKAGIVDKEDYQSEKSRLETNQLAYVNSTNTLKALVEKIPNAPKDIETITLADINILQEMLSKQSNEYTLHAPISGVVLIPEKTQGSDNSSSDKTLTVGSEVKQDQILLSIGDMSGISTTVNVSENDINQIAPQQTALVTSPALPGLLFYGKVTEISRQAKSDSLASGTAAFPVRIRVPAITDLQRELVRVGMTAKIDIAIQNPPQIKIPINAVFMVNDIPTVTVIDPKTGKQHNVAVETGSTDLTQVIILKGLKAGDKVVVRD